MIVRVKYCDVYEMEVPDEIFTNTDDEWQMRDDFWEYASEHIEFGNHMSDSYLMSTEFEND